MSQDNRDDFYDGRHIPEPSGPNLGVLLFLGVSLSVFVLGGLFFGLVFLSNLRMLTAENQRLSIDVSVAGSVSVPQVPQIQLPELDLSQNLPQAQPPVVLPEWQGEKPIGVLLMGVDRRSDEPVEMTRSDTMMLLLVHPQTRAAALVSLPRDLWVQIPGYGQQRLNVAHSVGGPALAKRTVEHNFGVPVDHFARIDFDGFTQIVDTLEGVIVDVERPIKDDHYPTEDYGYMRIYIPPGPQFMDGETALQYVRSRHSENDFGRMRRQQRFLLALRDRALQLDVLPKLPTLIGLIQRTVATDLGPSELLALARLGSEVDRDRISNVVLDARYADPYRSPDGADLLLPRTQVIQATLQEMLSTIAKPDQIEARVEVLNGSGRPGLAQLAADYVSAQGYRVVAVDNAEQIDLAESTIVALGSHVRAGQALASALNIPAPAVKEGQLDGEINIRLILGQSFRLPE